jgi:hypothetical protein
MEEKSLQIDAAAVAREALRQREPGEDLDEALLRACKKLHGDSGPVAFQALTSALGALTAQLKLEREAALQQIAGGGTSVRVSTTIRTTQKTSTKSMEELSPELRVKVEQAFAAGQNRAGAATHRCGYCDFEFPVDIATCPQCGRAVRRSLWSKLLGK